MARALFCLVVAGFALVSLPADARNVTVIAPRQTSRQAIRNLPILDRPNRFGHFYGNTVRRMHYRSKTSHRR